GALRTKSLLSNLLDVRTSSSSPPDRWHSVLAGRGSRAGAADSTESAVAGGSAADAADQSIAGVASPADDAAERTVPRRNSCATARAGVPGELSRSIHAGSDSSGGLALNSGPRHLRSSSRPRHLGHTLGGLADELRQQPPNEAGAQRLGVLRFAAKDHA